jgi:Transposase DDE domain
MQSKEDVTTNLVERLDWRFARRDESRIARRLWKKQAVDAIYSLEEGAMLDEFVHFLDEIGMASRWQALQGEGIKREMIDFFQYVLLYGMKTLFGIEAMNALPDLLFSDEAAMRLAGFNAVQIRQGICQRSHEKRQGDKPPGPLCPDTLADNIVKLSLTAMEAFLNGVVQALATAGVFARQVTGILDGTDLETTARYEGCGQVTRKRKITDKRGKVREIEVTVYGWKLLVMIEVRTKLPLAAKVVQIQDHEAPFTQELVTQARTNLADHARLRRVLFDRGFLDGADLWWLTQQGISFVVPAKENMAVTTDAHALAAVGAGVVARRVHTVAHGQGKHRWRERLETEVVGLADLTTYDQYGPEEHARQRYRKDFEEHPLNAVVVRKWNNRDYGPGGKVVFLTNETVDKPLEAFDAYDDRSLIENCCIKESKQAWNLKHPPQKTERAVQVHVFFTLAMFALATAYRLRAEQAAVGDEPVGWQRWRRQLIQQNRDKVIIFAQGWYGIFHVAEYSLLLGVRLREPPPEIGNRRDVLKKYGLVEYA